MTNESVETKSNYAWQKLTMLNPGEYPVAICLSKSNQMFTTAWNPISSTGYLQRWSAPQAKWLIIPGQTFKNPITQMCCDKLGNIYLIGDTNSKKNYVISIYNATNGWTDADNGYICPLNNICCDSNNNVYVSVSVNDIGYIMQYEASSKTWKNLGENKFKEPVLGLSLNGYNVLYVMSGNTISCWNGQKWNSFNPSNLQQPTGFGSDDSGNVYFNSASSIWSCHIDSQQSTNLNVPIQTFSGTTIYTNFFYIDEILYFTISGFTSEDETAAYVWVYAKGQWTDITPSVMNTNKTGVIYDIACYTGKSHNILLASNLNFVLDGKKLIL